MATLKQMEANRRNALKSTGPQSEAGKQRAAVNATRHGLYSNRVVMQYEHEEHFRQLRENLLRDWKPANSQQILLVEQIAQAAWRLQRAIRVETGTFDLYSRELCHQAGVDHNPHGDEGLAIVFAQNTFDLDRLRRYITALQRSYQSLIDQLVKLKAALPEDGSAADPPPAPPAPRVAAAAGGGGSAPGRVVELGSFRQINPRPDALPPNGGRSHPGSALRPAA